MKRKCRSLNRDGEQCRAWSMLNSEYCYSHYNTLLTDVGFARDDIRLITSRIMKVLSYGDDQPSLLKRLKNLKTMDPARFRRLGGICDRLDFAERIRHTMSVQGKAGEEMYLVYQQDRLTAYLTATCIDAASGQDRFQQFFNWLKSALKSGTLGDRTASLVEELASAESEASIMKVLARGMDTNREDSSAHEYLEEQGVRRGFKKALNSLDNWLKDWLSEAYFITEGEILEPRVVKEWLELHGSDKYDKIVNYLFGLRNTYTHSVAYRPTMEGVSGSFTTPINGVRYRFRSIRNNAGAEKDIGLREELSETDVIGLLVVSYLRNNWLYLNDEQSFLRIYLERVGYRRLRFQFLFELQQNMKLVKAWCSNHLLLQRYSTRPLTGISTAKAKDFFEAHRIQGGGSLGIHAIEREYLHAAERINTRISTFNQSGDTEDPFSSDRFIEELSRSEEAARLVQFIEDVTVNFIENELYY